MIDDGALLAGDDRVIDRAMRGGDDAGIGGRGGDSRCPGVGFEPGSRRIELVAEAAPARHRHGRFEFHRVGELGQRKRVRPGDFQTPFDVRHQAAVIEIGLESSELEFAAIENRIGRMPISVVDDVVGQ